ncbi:MAG TPA: SCO family protein [Chthoniobacter sp.]
MAGTLFATTPPAFETLITQDADTQQGLTEFRSSSGLLNLQMAAVYTINDPNGTTMPANPELGDPTQQFIYPRLAFSCQDSTHQVTSYAGPLLRARPGDRIHIQFTNGLATQRTNLHFHGLDVSPHAETAGTFGDFVSLPYVLSTAPGNTRTYDFTIPANELPGPFWYHAHAHGVAEMQVACGLSGALYIEGTVASYISALQTRLKPLQTSGTVNSKAAVTQTLSEVASTLPQLPHHLLVLKDFWTPGLGPINGPLEQSVNGKVTYSVQTGACSPYVIQYGAADQLWEITNQSANMYYILTFTGSNLGSAGFYVLAQDGIPTASGLSTFPLDNALMIPPASRATVVVPTAAFNGGTVHVTAQMVNTLGDNYFQVGNQVGQRPAPWNLITMTPVGGAAPAGVTPWAQLASSIQSDLLATAGAAQPFPPKHTVDATYVFAEPNTGGDTSQQPANIQFLPPEPTEFSFYRLADAHGAYVKGPADAYDNYEPPIAQLWPGQPQHWIIQNTTAEWHDFHLHQAHFIVEGFTVINDLVHPLNNTQPPVDNEGNPFYATNEPPPPGSGKLVGQPFYSGPVDTVSIPDGLQVWVTLPLTEGAQIEGQFVMHCHILEHEDGGMMANVVAGPIGPYPLPGLGQKSAPHLPPMEVARVKIPTPAVLQDSAGAKVTSDIFRKNDFSLVTFGYTTCQGACPMTLEKCVAALSKLRPAQAARVSPFFVSLDVERDNTRKLRDYAQMHRLSANWKTLLDTNLVTSRAFGAQRSVLRKPDGSIYLRHTTTIYLIDRSMQIRAAFDEEDSPEEMSQRLQKELQAPGVLLPAARHASS